YDVLKKVICKNEKKCEFAFSEKLENPGKYHYGVYALNSSGVCVTDEMGPGTSELQILVEK
ncbi:hypothetical protein ACFL35_02730, partial [Candidatus Riflebacteria bacterium]